MLHQDKDPGQILVTIGVIRERLEKFRKKMKIRFD
jgi:hypothetical protein